MEILNLFPSLFLIIWVSVWLAACGGGSDSEPVLGADTKCVLGSSKIGNCKM